MISRKHTSLKDWVSVLMLLTEILALISLWVTQEIHLVVWGVVIVLWSLRYFFKPKWSAFVLVITFILLIFCAFMIYSQLKFPPLLAVAHVLPIAHLLLTFQKESFFYRGWQIGIGFTQILLAAALSPDFGLAVLVIFYCFLAMAAVSLLFLESEYSEFAPQELLKPLPSFFIRTQFQRAVLLLIFAAIVFPFLPRISERIQFAGTSVQSGYTEKVSRARWQKLGSNDAIALRLYGGEETFSEIIYGLLRTRVLVLIDDDTWQPQLDHEFSRPARSFSPVQYRSLDVIRESLDTDRVSSPYGSFYMSGESNGYSVPVFLNSKKEWVDERSKNQRYKYKLRFASDQKTLLENLAQDQPTKVYTNLPSNFQKTRAYQWSKNKFKNLPDARAKADALLRHYSAESFQANLDGPVSEEISSKHPIDQFLFRDKKGHCEVFATATALVLRNLGVPTRLVSGFRISRWSSGDVLTVRMSDAHAWVEYYQPQKGWIPIDPTPRVLYVPSFKNWVLDIYDWVSGKWYQYVLSYGDTRESTLFYQMPQWIEGFKKIKKTGLIIFSIGLISVFVLFFILLKRKPQGVAYSQSRKNKILVRERINFEKKLQKNKTIENNNALHSWWSEYYRLRFSQYDESRFNDEFKKLKKMGDSIF